MLHRQCLDIFHIDLVIVSAEISHRAELQSDGM